MWHRQANCSRCAQQRQRRNSRQWKLWQRSWETNTLLVPQPKSWGDQAPPVPTVVAPMQDWKHQLLYTHLCLQTQQVMYFLSNLSSVARGALQFSQRYRGASSNISCTIGQFSRHASHLSMFQSTQSLHAAHGNTKIRAINHYFLNCINHNSAFLSCINCSFDTFYILFDLFGSLCK